MEDLNLLFQQFYQVPQVPQFLNIIHEEKYCILIYC